MEKTTVKMIKQFRRFLPVGIYEIPPGLARAIIKKEFAEETDEAPGSPEEVQARYDEIAEAEVAEKKKEAEKKRKATAARRKKRKEEKRKMANAPGPSNAKQPGPTQTGKKRTPVKGKNATKKKAIPKKSKK